MTVVVGVWELTTSMVRVVNTGGPGFLPGWTTDGDGQRGGGVGFFDVLVCVCVLGPGFLSTPVIVDR